MNIENFKLTCSLKFGRSILLAKKFSPEILTGAGIVGVVVAGVMVGRATLKAVPVIEQLKEDRAVLSSNRDRIDSKMYTKGLTQVYTKAGVELGKIYGPAVTTGLASLACILGAQGIMSKRNAGIAAAYKTLEEGFSQYRERVQEELGEEQEMEVYRGVVEEEVIAEDGTKSIEKRIDPNTISGYARYFDSNNVNWNEQSEYNVLWVRAQQAQLNNNLQARGHVFLNDVYDALGLERSTAGTAVGWVRGQGDNFIDFGLYNPMNQAAHEFVNGKSNGLFLDFNVQGAIYNLIEKA